MVTVTIDGETRQYEEGTRYEEIAKEYQSRYPYRIGLITADGKIRELMKRVKKDCELTFITLDDPVGHKTYMRTAVMLLIKALHDVAGDKLLRKVKVEFAIGPGYYCSIDGDFKLDSEFIDRLNKRMREIAEADVPITKKAYPINEAMEIFRRQNMKDKEKLFRYRRSSYVNVYCLDGYYDYYYGYMLPSTGYVKYFEVFSYEDGLMLLIPDREMPDKLPMMEPREKLFETLKKSDEWGNMVGVDTVGDLNDHICSGDINDLILVQEALQERRIGEIAQDIVQRGGVKFVMIAGPSSSGKTTFSHRLSIQLRTYGLTPHPIALDNYFVNRDKTPLDENGDYNFECLEAIDVEQFNQDMTDLLNGKTVDLPSFNFKSGLREYSGNYKTLGEEDILVIEGIHGLNDATSYSLPNESKYKIYISALTSINIDEHNRIPTTDGRLLRRMVRDARTRGASAKRTIEMWNSVRKGEEEYIFPFQESADAMFNSALIYELAILKQYAEPLLFGIEKGEPEYYEAKRLLKFLEYFIGISGDNLPKNSICREFVGGSCFHV
ncbi:nucleoside kinase [Kineothrix sp. MB12-C1]|uniref:nucleoside kinase n=1 Tax=Kineothrix sp. MB12-C1 TaxID=3070215 RepID=UPI0027D28EB2|nr:nucleoside kinase [Kineothrix sp. MB12-C1]WMC92109.1 nucleoside kinase [Kineothrix sp. MB12-C1]